MVEDVLDEMERCIDEVKESIDEEKIVVNEEDTDPEEKTSIGRKWLIAGRFFNLHERKWLKFLKLPKVSLQIMNTIFPSRR